MRPPQELERRIYSNACKDSTQCAERGTICRRQRRMAALLHTVRSSFSSHARKSFAPHPARQAVSPPTSIPSASACAQTSSEITSQSPIIARPKTSHPLGSVVKSITYTKASRPPAWTCKRSGNSDYVEMRYLTRSTKNQLQLCRSTIGISRLKKLSIIEVPGMGIQAAGASGGGSMNKHANGA